MKKLTALLLFSCLAAASVRADVIFQELFQYTNGPIIITSTNSVPPTNAVWIRHSGSASPSDAYVNNNRLENAATGGSPVSRQDDVHRFFPAAYTNAGPIVVYASFVVNCTNVPGSGGTYFAHFYTNSSAFFCRVFALPGVLPNTYRLGLANASGSANVTFPVDLATNQNYQVVMKWDPVSSWKATLWVNPVSSSDSPVVASDAVSANQTAPIQALAFRQGSSGGNWFATISNAVVATTYNEAVTNVLPTNAVAPVIAYQPPAVISNFVGAAFTLPALANGQGLGSLTYDWQVSATPDNASPQDVANVSDDASGDNANVLTFTSADNTDNGYYTLIATTPYGLSVTSSVTKIAISATPVPPSFVTEPVSQTVFRGTTVTLSTSVTSPGDVAFTWYSNNVVVTAGQVDNGYSSTYTLNNVTTNNSATFKVAVTNDYATAPNNGVISTNAVLTVSNPPVVSIAYLRSLIDPNTFVTTSPLTQPFQVTAIITSYTNQTTGNTANYYLQDATAGIDMFVTYGSTFRPQLGDVVTFDGVLSTYNGNTGGLELYADTNDYAYTSYTIVSNNFPLPAARVIPFTVTNDYGYLYVNTNLMGSLVTLTNVYFGTNAGTIISTNADEVVTVTNAGGLPFALEFYDLDLATAGQTLPAFAYSVTGNLIGFQPNVYLAVSAFSNLVTTPPPPPPTIVPTVSPGITSFSLLNNGNVVITGTNAQTTGVYYLLASTNVANPVGQWKVVATNVVNTNGANGAFTFIGTNVASPGATNQFYILSNTNSNHP
jgi:hypothetical protein